MCQLNYPTLTLAIALFAPAAGNLPPTGPAPPHDPCGQFFEFRISAATLPIPVLTNRPRQAREGGLTDVRVPGVAPH